MARFETLLKGRVLNGRYLIEELLGRGGMGAVFRARDQRLERPVALKIISFPDHGGTVNEGLRKRFLREAKAAAKLNHRNVVAIYDNEVDAELDLDFLVMELLFGMDVARYLAEQGTPPQQLALAWLQQASRGVAAGHRAGLIHRDIKPANLFLAHDEDEGTRLVVLDFGIALPSAGDETLTRLTVADRGPHSQAYAAPEQLQGVSLTPACDVFSLAATAFELFTGTPMARPGEAAGTAAAIDRARSELGQFPLSAKLLEVLHRALSPKPEDRFRDAAELGLALARTDATPAAVRVGTRADPLVDAVLTAGFAPAAVQKPPPAAKPPPRRLQPHSVGIPATCSAPAGSAPKVATQSVLTAADVVAEAARVEKKGGEIGRGVRRVVACLIPALIGILATLGTRWVLLQGATFETFGRARTSTEANLEWPKVLVISLLSVIVGARTMLAAVDKTEDLISDEAPFGFSVVGFAVAALLAEVVIGPPPNAPSWYTWGLLIAIIFAVHRVVDD
jgi:hypothetical protein